MRRGYFDLPWGQVHYRTVDGNGDLPVLIMLHQTPLSSRNYERALPLLAQECRPFALDTPGYGGSSMPPGQWEVADYAALVWQFADHIGSDKVHLFGRATGTVFALEAALSAPHRVQSLFLHGAALFTDTERTGRLASYTWTFEPGAEAEHLAWIWARIHREYPWIGPELATHFVADYLATGGDFSTAYRAIFRHDVVSRIATLPLPDRVMLLSGSADRIHYMQARAVAQMPKARAVTLEGATDFVAEQQPEVFAAELLGFLRGTPGGT